MVDRTAFIFLTMDRLRCADDDQDSNKIIGSGCAPVLPTDSIAPDSIISLATNLMTKYNFAETDILVFYRPGASY